MPNTPNLENLALAVAAERAALENCRQENYEIFGKMMAYQDGRGPAPTVEEFVHWRNSIQQIIFEKNLDSGSMDL